MHASVLILAGLISGCGSDTPSDLQLGAAEAASDIVQAFESPSYADFTGVLYEDGSVDLSWAADESVLTYDIYRNSIKIATVETHNFYDEPPRANNSNGNSTEVNTAELLAYTVVGDIGGDETSVVAENLHVWRVTAGTQTASTIQNTFTTQPSTPTLAALTESTPSVASAPSTDSTTAPTPDPASASTANTAPTPEPIPASTPESTLASTSTPDTAPALATPTLLNVGSELSGATHTFSFSDSNAPDGRLYDPSINGIDQGNSFSQPQNSFSSNIDIPIPTDGSTVTLDLYYSDDEFETINVVSGLYLAHIEQQSTTTPAPQLLPAATTANPALVAAFDAQFDLKANWYSYRDSPKYRENYTGEQMYTGWPAMWAMSSMHKNTGDIKYLDTAVDLAIRYIDDHQDLAGTGHGGTFAIDGFLDTHWGSSSNPGYISHWHYDWRAQAGIANAGLELHRSGVTVEAHPNALADIKAFLIQGWDKWEPTQPADGNRSNSIDATRFTYFLTRIMNMAIFLDATHATPGNNKYSTYLNNGRPAELAAKMKGLFLNGAPAEGIPTRWSDTQDDSSPIDISHGNDITPAFYMAYQNGHTLGGNLDSQFFNDWAEYTTTVTWPTTQTHPYANLNGTGTPGTGNSCQVASLGLLGSQDSAFLTKFDNYILNNETCLAIGSFHEVKMMRIASAIEARSNGSN